MMKKISWTILLALCLLAAAFAAPTGANITAGAADTLAISGVVGNTTINGGEVMSIDINNTFSTSKWAGFFGEISAGLALGNAAGDEFYSWTVTDVTNAIVYAASATTDFSGLAGAVDTDLPASVQSVATDSFYNTFILGETITAGTTAANGLTANYTVTNSGTGTLKTYALVDTADTYIMAGQAVNDATGFDTTQVDFQILAPADSSTSYFFYVELP